MSPPFKIPLPQQWINPDGSPTVAFYKFIYNLFGASTGGGVPAGSIQSNITGGVASPVANSLSSILDAVVGNVRGDLLYRSGTLWVALPLGSANFALTSNGTDAVYAAVVKSIGGVSGLSFSSTGGAVSVGFGNSVVFAAGAPSVLNNEGGDLAIRSFTGNVQVGNQTGTVTLGTNGGIIKAGQTSKAAAVAANFSASRFITIQDATGTLFFVPAAAAPW